MTDDELGGFREFEDEVRRALTDEADGITPHHRLGAILAVTEEERPHRRRWWLVSAAAAVVLVAVIGVGLALRPTTTAATSSAAGAQEKQAQTDGQTAPSAGPSDGRISPNSVTWAMPVYVVVTGTTANPWLLQRSYWSVDDPGDRQARAQAAVTALLSGRTPDGNALGVYAEQQPWKDGTTAKVTVTDAAIGVVLSTSGRIGLTAQQQRIAVQSIVWTATAAAGITVPVQVERESGGLLIGTMSPGAYERAVQTFLDLAPISVNAPAPGETVTSPVTVAGEACVFEASFGWQVLAGSAVVASGSAQAATGCPTRGSYTIPLGTLESGAYTLRLYETSAADGSVSFETRVDFTVA